MTVSVISARQITIEISNKDDFDLIDAKPDDLRRRRDKSLRKTEIHKSVNGQKVSILFIHRPER